MCLHPPEHKRHPFRSPASAERRNLLATSPLLLVAQFPRQSLCYRTPAESHYRGDCEDHGDRQSEPLQSGTYEGSDVAGLASASMVNIPQQHQCNRHGDLRPNTTCRPPATNPGTPGSTTRTIIGGRSAALQ